MGTNQPVLVAWHGGVLCCAWWLLWQMYWTHDDARCSQSPRRRRCHHRQQHCCQHARAMMAAARQPPQNQSVPYNVYTHCRRIITSRTTFVRLLYRNGCGTRKVEHGQRVAESTMGVRLRSNFCGLLCSLGGGGGVGASTHKCRHFFFKRQQGGAWRIKIPTRTTHKHTLIYFNSFATISLARGTTQTHTHIKNERMRALTRLSHKCTHTHTRPDANTTNGEQQRGARQQQQQRLHAHTKSR